MSGTAQQVEPPDGDPPPDGGANIETRARNMGWMPKQAWRGEDSRWVDAATYVERGERMLPLLQERNRALDKTVSDLKAESQESKRLLADLVVRTRKAEKIGYDRAMRELQTKRAEAVTAGDAEAFNKVEAEIQGLGPPPEPEPAPQRPPPQANGGAPDVNPVVTAWVRRNTWFNRDPIANAAAVAALSQVEREFPGDTLEEHLVEVEQRIAARFPEHFPQRRRATGNGDGTGGEGEGAGDRRRQPAAVLASGSAPARRANPRSFEAMPADVRAQYERQKKMMAGKGEPLSREEFASYFWDAEGE